jgi:hypothetical protein
MVRQVLHNRGSARSPVNIHYLRPFRLVVVVVNEKEDSIALLTLKVGQRYGEWTLEKRLGEGGNGVVGRVHHHDDRSLARKHLPSY